MSAFQHRHYAAIAAVLADAKQGCEGIEKPDRELAEIGRVQEGLVQMFKRDNSGFKPERFERAARRADNMHGKDKR